MKHLPAEELGVAIDACQYRFIDLTMNVFPNYLADLRAQFSESPALSDFASSQIKFQDLLDKLGTGGDFAGCYVILKERKTPIYTGISRKVIRRLRQHVRGKTHFDASLAYRMAAKAAPHKKTRSDAMLDDNFQKAFNEAQLNLRSSHCSFVRIDNALERHLFEAFCAMELDTAEWNTFETH